MVHCGALYLLAFIAFLLRQRVLAVDVVAVDKTIPNRCRRHCEGVFARNVESVKILQVSPAFAPLEICLCFCWPDEFSRWVKEYNVISLQRD